MLGALSGMNATLTGVNAIFERDFGITLELIANNDLDYIHRRQRRIPIPTRQSPLNRRTTNQYGYSDRLG